MSYEYTPTTEDIEVSYALGRVEFSPGSGIDLAAAHAEFREWLARVRAEAWDEGHEAGQINEHEYRPGRRMTNPYTAADTQGIPNYYEED